MPGLKEKSLGQIFYNSAILPLFLSRLTESFARKDNGFLGEALGNKEGCEMRVRLA